MTLASASVPVLAIGPGPSQKLGQLAKGLCLLRHSWPAPPSSWPPLSLIIDRNLFDSPRQGLKGDCAQMYLRMALVAVLCKFLSSGCKKMQESLGSLGKLDSLAHSDRQILCKAIRHLCDFVIQPARDVSGSCLLQLVRSRDGVARNIISLTARQDRSSTSLH